MTTFEKAVLSRDIPLRTRSPRTIQKGRQELSSENNSELGGWLEPGLRGVGFGLGIVTHFPAQFTYNRLGRYTAIMMNNISYNISSTSKAWVHPR